MRSASAWRSTGICRPSSDPALLRRSCMGSCPGFVGGEYCRSPTCGWHGRAVRAVRPRRQANPVITAEGKNCLTRLRSFPTGAARDPINRVETRRWAHGGEKSPRPLPTLADFLICRTTRFSGLISRVTRLAASSGNLTICSVSRTVLTRCATRQSQLSALDIIILLADKELFPPRQYRRSAGVGFHCRPDGLQREERIWDLWQMPGLLPPMETPE